MSEPLVLIVGGSDDHLGGVEAFCERSAAALTARGGWRTDRIAASTAYLTLRRTPRFMRGLARLIERRKPKPDIVWVQYVNLPDLAYVVVARMLGMRVLVTPHLGVNWRSQGNPTLRRISERTLRLAHRLALISWTQEQEVALPKEVPRSLIRNFLPVEVLSGPMIDAANLPPVLQLIHSSRLSEGKGTFLVVELCRALRDRGIAFAAKITGSGSADMMARLHTMIAEHRLGAQIAVLGRVPEAELLDHLRHADVLVHLSSIDSYPLIVLEAMACAVSPIVKELAGARDMVQTYGGYVAPKDDTVAASAAWLAACDLATLRRERGLLAARVRADYDWSRCAAALAAALEACLAGETAAAEQLEHGR